MPNQDAYVKQLEDTVSKLEKQIENLTDMVLILRNEKFGSSSEKTPKNHLDGQLSLFNEAETYASNPEPEPIKATVKGYVRTNPKTKREELIKDLPVREVLCDIEKSQCYCGQCGDDLKAI